MSARGECRRRERAARKGRLCVADAYRLNQNRRLPKGHPSFAKGEPRMTSASVARIERFASAMFGSPLWYWALSLMASSIRRRYSACFPITGTDLNNSKVSR